MEVLLCRKKALEHPENHVSTGISFLGEGISGSSEISEDIQGNLVHPAVCNGLPS